MTTALSTRWISSLTAAALAATGVIATAPGAAAADRLVLDVGHTDAFEVSLQEGDLALNLKDDTLLHTDQIVYRDPADVLFQVLPQAAITVPDSPNFGFLGEPGDTVFVLPQAQDPDLLWPGWSTERLSSSQIDGQVQLELVGFDGPGELKLWTTGSFGDSTMLLDTADDAVSDSWNVNVPAHVHGNWAFTEAGSYTLTVEATATLADGGTEVATGGVEYAFHVGDLPEPVETSLSIEGMGHHYHTGDTISLTAVQDPATDLDHYHWFTIAAGSDEEVVVPDAGTDSLELIAGDDPALDGTQVIAKLYGDDHDVVATSDPVTIVIDDHDDHDHDAPHTSVCDRHQGTATFPDVPGSGHGAFIDCLAALGVVQGTADGSYAPADDVSRAQLASFVVRAVELATDESLPIGSGGFPDVAAGSTHGQAIAKLAEAGIIRGYEDGTFGPTDPVSRQQTARYVVGALELVLDASLPRSGASFTDVQAGSQYAGDIDALVTAGVVSGFTDGTFGPREPVTRGQMARFIANALEVLADEGSYLGP